MITKEKIGVHVTHCCIVHGCKYGQDDECPVVQGVLKQAYVCEDCSYHGIETLDDVEQVVYGKATVCPNCGYKLN